MRVLLVCGSLRDGSTNMAALRAAHAIDPAGTELYDGLAGLPHFNPDDDREPLPPAVAALRARLAECAAVLFCTPEYAGALPGSLKNLLDWTVGGGETYGKPVAWINVSGSAAPTGGAGAHAELRAVLGYTGTDIVEAACLRLPLTRGEPVPREPVAGVLRALVRHARLRAAYTAFNARDADGVLAHLRPDVDWPNAWEGGRVHGHDEVRAYWERQWAEIDPTVEPVAITPRDEDRVAVEVLQEPGGGRVVHVHTFGPDGLVTRMDVEDPPQRAA